MIVTLRRPAATVGSWPGFPAGGQLGLAPAVGTGCGEAQGESPHAQAQVAFRSAMAAEQDRSV